MSRFGPSTSLIGALSAALGAPMPRTDATIAAPQSFTLSDTRTAFRFTLAVVANSDDLSRPWWMLRVASDTLPHEWTGATWAKLRTQIESMPFGELVTERALQMTRHLCVVRRLTEKEYEQLTETKSPLYPVQLFGGPLRERWRSPQVRDAKWAAPCKGPRVSTFRMRSAPVDCGQCGPCMARRASDEMVRAR